MNTVDPKQGGPVLWQGVLACNHAVTVLESVKRDSPYMLWCAPCAYTMPVTLWRIPPR